LEVEKPLVQKVNSNDLLSLNGRADLAASTWMGWSCDQFNASTLAGIVSSPVSSVRLPGKALLQLTIKEGSLIPGAIYVFRLAGSTTFDAIAAEASSTVTSSTHYVPKIIQATSEVTISVNRSPRDGSLLITPIDLTKTYALSEFRFRTQGWVDDVSDYPMDVAMGYYRVEIRDMISVSDWSTKTEQIVLLGEGFENLDYVVTGVAQARDVFGGIGQVFVKRQVLPHPDPAVASAGVAALLIQANATKNSELFDQVLYAAVAGINKRGIICGKFTAEFCRGFGREPCGQGVSESCGKCLTGFDGPGGPANYPPCVSPVQSQNALLFVQQQQLLVQRRQQRALAFAPNRRVTSVVPKSLPEVWPWRRSSNPSTGNRRLQTSVLSPGDILRLEGQTCGVHADCFTANCKSGRCRRTHKTCPSACNVAGNCVTYSSTDDTAVTVTDENRLDEASTGEPTVRCMSEDASCFVKCDCFPGRYGAACALLEPEYFGNRETREQLCVGLQESLNTRSLDAAAVSSRGVQLLDLLVDQTQVTQAAFDACAAVTTQICSAQPELAAQGGSLSTFVTIYSQLLELRSLATDAQLTSIDTSLKRLLQARQSSTSLGEVSQSVEKNLRFFTAKYTYAVLGDQSDIFPRSFDERLSAQVHAHVRLGEFDVENPQLSTVGISALQLNRPLRKSGSPLNSSMVEVLFSRYGSVQPRSFKVLFLSFSLSLFLSFSLSLLLSFSLSLLLSFSPSLLFSSRTTYYTQLTFP
jgi:hypothetical protein